VSTQHEWNNSPHDVVEKARRLSQAVIGQIHRSRGAHAKAVVDMAIGAWEAVATPENVAKLAMQTMPGSDAAEIVGRLLKDTLVHLDDFLQVAHGDAKIIRDAGELIRTAVGAVTRHS